MTTNDNQPDIRPEVAATRFFQFLGSTLAVVGLVFIITTSQWFWIMFGAGWLMLFFGLWGKDVIAKGVKEKANSEAQL